MTSLEGFGYRQELQRTLSIWDLIVYGMVFMVPISPFGVFGFVWKDANGMVPLAYLVGLVGMFFTAMSYASMARAFPMAGSVYSYVGRGLHATAGFFAGWLILLDYILVPALLYIFSAVALRPLAPGVPGVVWLLGFVTFNAAVNLLGIRLAARVNLYLLLLEILALMLFVIMGLVALHHGQGAGALTLKPLYDPAVFSMATIAGAASIAVLSFLGFDGVSTLAEESRGGGAAVARATVASLVAVGALFVLQTWIATDLAQGMHFSSPETAFYEIAERAGGAGLRTVTLGVNVLASGIANAMVAQAAVSRILYAMGRDGKLPSVLEDASESWTTGLSAYVTSYGPGNGGIGAAYADEDNQSHQTTEELRIASVGDTHLKWLAGYFYSDFQSGWDIIFPSQTGAGVFGSNNLFSYYSPFKILQQSEFGELTYNVTDPFAITLGARHYHYSAPVGLDQYGALTATVVTRTSEKDQGVTPKVSLSYQFDKDLLVYATAAKGFRPGGGTGPVPTSGPLTCEPQLQVEYGSKGFVNGPISFSSDTVWSYELGEKWRSSDNRFSVNASGYFESWVGVQQVNALSSCGYVYTANVGDAHVYGSEIEARAIVVHDLEASANVTYSHAALVSSTLIDAGFNPGTAIQQVPKVSASVALAYRHDLTDGLALTARAESSYVGSRTDETFATNTLPSYELTNIRGGFAGERWSAVLYVSNVADKRALLNNITQAAENLPTFNRVAVSQPRTTGIDLNYRFGR